MFTSLQPANFISTFSSVLQSFGPIHTACLAIQSPCRADIRCPLQQTFQTRRSCVIYHLIYKMDYHFVVQCIADYIASPE
uniref:Uncharacterized protein n=1 Tax=Arundo donax TaxID=35708 RepID=A0A0A8Z5C5_ARUDO